MILFFAFIFLKKGSNIGIDKFDGRYQQRFQGALEPLVVPLFSVPAAVRMLDQPLV
jgi:hypothetical protein